MKSCKKIHEFEIPKKPKIELKYESINKYIENGIQSEPINTYQQLNRFYRLLALRDQECPNSKGYENYKIRYFSIAKPADKWVVVECLQDYVDVKFKTKEDAELICNILNENRFNLEGE